ncbi:MAG: polyphosphate kinase 1 [Chloroflexota bacterium]
MTSDAQAAGAELNRSPSPRFFNRELSWIEFNRRVLREASNPRHPLLERVKLLAISDSNLDEFLMVRVSGLMGEVEAGVSTRGPDGRTPVEELNEARQALRPLIAEQRRVWEQELLPQLAARGIHIVTYTDLTASEREIVKTYFEREVFPVCTPLAIDFAQPFPFISNVSLNLAVVLRDVDGTSRLARLKVPPPFPRLMRLPGRAETAEMRLIWLEDVLRHHLDALFPALSVEQAYPFRVLRDADFEIREIEAGDLLEKVRAGLQMRRFGDAVALQMIEDVPVEVVSLLASNLALSEQDIYTSSGPLGLAALFELQQLDRPDLKDEPFVPRVPTILAGKADMFAAIRHGDILLHHPFDSFDPVIDLLEQAAADPDVLAIKQTLYRVGQHSPVVEALRGAVDVGKQAAVLVELKARFDEENNIGWAKELERAGVHVMYGFAEVKVHAKVALIVRRELGSIRRYVHIGTGNYNPTTARLYTDIGLLTCREDIGADASELFNFLTGYSHQTDYRALLVAPVNLRQGLLRCLDREIAAQKKKGNGHLILKMNALEDPEIIQALYAASRAGVRVDLLVRGICCLRPGVPGMSDNVTVLSLVGRFLEHSRIFYFHNNGSEEVLIGSADVMQRNLDHRVEGLVPIFDARIRRRLKAVLDGYLADTRQTHMLQPDGRYTAPAGGEHDMQERLLREGREVRQSALPLRGGGT